MTDIMWITSHVRLLLQQTWGADEVSVDSDGDFPFRSGTAMCWVSVLDGAVPMVRVFAHAAFGLKSSAKLLRELNDIENRCLSARVTLGGGVVRVSQTISPIGLTQPVLLQALDAVSTVADDIGGLLAAVYAGHTPFEAELDVDQEAS